MKKINKLVVTLADINYLQRAKQLFSSVYFNSGWEGDYLLLACGIPNNKLSWFKQRGVLIEPCRALFRGKIGRYSPVLSCKIYLFQKKFKKWDNIIYLDSDIIVRGPIDRLCNVSGYAAVQENNDKQLSEQFKKNKNISKKTYVRLMTEIKSKYNLNKPAFNAGVFAFNTIIIKDDTFANFKKILLKYGNISCYGDQGIQNLFFYNNWDKLPLIYNLFPGYFMHKYNVTVNQIKGIIIHFADQGNHSKPWMLDNPLYAEWKNNLDRANQIENFTRNMPMPDKLYETKSLANMLYRSLRLKVAKLFG